jgi:hypothetical protein
MFVIREKLYAQSVVLGSCSYEVKRLGRLPGNVSACSGQVKNACCSWHYFPDDTFKAC